MIDTSLKVSIITQINQHLNDSKSRLLQDLAALDKGMSDDTKSSAGDKYETSREMTAQQIRHTQLQLAKVEEQRLLIASIDWQKVHQTVEVGALVKAGDFIFLLGGQIGLVPYEGQSVYALTMLAPIAQQMLGKKVGSTIQFQNKTVPILSVI